MRILYVVGARPNFVKIAPLVRESANQAGVEAKLVHTGQHYDYQMSKSFFEDFAIPEPDFFLAAGSGSHAEQTARIMIAFEKVCRSDKPDLVVVVGDVNSTLACSVTAKKLHVTVAHVEAGLRSRDMSMPEEINRLVTDAISDYLFVSEKSGLDNLKAEGKGDDQVFYVGNIMIDTLYHCLGRLEESAGSPRQSPYAVVTLHRPSNVDEKGKLEELLTALVEISRDMPVHFPMHPRTEKNVQKFGLGELLAKSGVVVAPPMSYPEFLALWKDACLVLTDSGGIQEETTALGVPCFTIRDNTERPVTVEEGTNILVGTTGEGVLRNYAEFKSGKVKKGRVPELWDGRTAERILRVLMGR